jgi:heme exporter protein C
MAGKKKVNVPEAGQWPDKFAVPALAAGAVLTTVGFLMAFLFAAPVNGAALDVPELVNGVMITHQQLISQKIFYFHMPVAIVSFIALAFAAYYGIRFLTTREVRFDTCSRVAMEIALLFVVFTMVTGDLWTRFEWGVWWTWEPRLTTYLILMLIAIAYFVMRNSVDDPERRATYAGVISIIALVDVPICFMITRLIPSSVHPVITREGGMAPDMAATVVVIMIGMLLVGYGLYRLRFRQARLDERLQALKEQLES